MPEESTSRELFPLSIVILTKNEEDHLQDCLESCQWAEDILVVDSGSRDRTVEIARSFGAYVIHQGWMGFGPQRRFAVSQAVYVEYIHSMPARPSALRAASMSRMTSLPR